MPKTNPAGIALIKSFEQCVLFTYDDAKYPPTPLRIGQACEGTPTNGFGHTGPDVHPSQAITQAQADANLEADLERFERGVNNLLARSINSNQFSALVSFAYNAGLGALRGSTLLRMVNLGNMSAAADEFGKWIYVAGEVSEGLVRRRAAERALFETPC